MNKLNLNTKKGLKALGPTLSFVVLLISLAPMGLLIWLEKAGIFILNSYSDKTFFFVMTAFLSVVLLTLLYSAKSEKKFRIVSWVVFSLAILNLSGCMLSY